MLAFSDSTAYNFIVKVYIEIADLSSFADSVGSACSPYSSIEQTAFRMKQRYFNEYPDYTILRTENGRPYFAHTDALFFNGSHTKKYCITAMAEKHLAVDIEQCRPKHFQAIAEYAFTETEREWLTQSKEIEKDFFLLWTIKEADIKLHGGSIFSISNAVRINPVEQTAVSRVPINTVALNNCDSSIANTAQCCSSIDKGSTTICSDCRSAEDAGAVASHTENYPHSIFSFYLTMELPEQTVHFVASIIIAGQDTDIEFEWYYGAELPTRITVERIFACPSRKA